MLDKLPWIAAAALTVLVAYNLAVLTWRVAAPAPKARIELVSRTSMQGYTPRQRPEYASRIASLHLFGQALEAPAPQALDAPETRLNLTLRGVYATGDEHALAIIDAGPGSEKFYRVG